MKKSRKPNKRIIVNNSGDHLLLVFIFVLSCLGLLMVFDSSIVEASEAFADKFHYLKYQGFYLIISWIVLFITSRFDYHYYKKLIKILFYINIFALLLVFTPIGMEIKGARRWLNLGFTSVQPSEFLKTVLVLYLSTWLEKPRTIAQFFSLILFVLAMIMFQPDLGTSIVIILTAFIIYYVSGTDIFKFALISFAAALLGIILIMTSSYRRQRFLTFINPSQDNSGTSYHIQQITLSIGSGGLTGLGIGNSKQKYQFLPEAMTDSIFAIVAEEVGFIGSVLIILIFLIIIWRCLKISQNAPDLYGRYIAVGIISWISIQTFLNLSSMLSLVPLTGVPLPFFSYGGTALLVTMASMGVIINISRQSHPSSC